MEVDHIDRDGSNNRLDNLRYVTPKENCANRRNLVGIEHNLVKLTEDEVLLIRKLAGEGSITQREIALRFGICRPLVSLIKHRKLWKALKDEE